MSLRLQNPVFGLKYSVAVTAAVMVMLATVFMVVVMVMGTFYCCIVFQCTVHIRLRLLIRIAAHTAAQFDALLRQCSLCTAADTARRNSPSSRSSLLAGKPVTYPTRRPFSSAASSAPMAAGEG